MTSEREREIREKLDSHKRGYYVGDLCLEDDIEVILAEIDRLREVQKVYIQTIKNLQDIFLAQKTEPAWDDVIRNEDGAEFHRSGAV